MSFFFADANEKTSKSKKVIPLNSARELGCRVCPLKKQAKNPDLQPHGSDRPLFYFLGDAPDDGDDAEQKVFSGSTGQLLRSNIPAKYRDTIRYNTVVRSHPPGNRKPEDVEIECCRNSIIADIEVTKPPVLVAVGAIALYWCLEQRDLAKWRGRTIPVKIGTHICWLYPIYHPKDITSRQRISSTGNTIQTEWDHIFALDLKTLFECA